MDDDFGLWDILVSMFWFMLLVAWFALLFRIIADIFRDDSLSGGGKARLVASSSSCSRGWASSSTSSPAATP